MLSFPFFSENRLRAWKQRHQRHQQHLKMRLWPISSGHFAKKLYVYGVSTDTHLDRPRTRDRLFKKTDLINLVAALASF
jgi:hypothetical protein